jgi:CDP-diglyceride synthetase
MIRHFRFSRIPIVLLPLVSLALAACDPVVNIAGANFPAWLLCAIVGAVLAAAFRPGFVATRIEQYLGPLMLIYPCLAILLGCATYLIFFNRV